MQITVRPLRDSEQLSMQYKIFMESTNGVVMHGTCLRMFSNKFKCNFQDFVPSANDRYNNFIEVEALCALQWLANMADSKCVQEDNRTVRSIITAVLQQVLIVMRAFPMHAEMQAGALRVLAKMRSNGLIWCRAEESRIDDSAFLALKSHTEHVGVQRDGLEVLASVNIEAEYRCAKVNTSACVAAVVALRRFPEQLEVQRNALLVLGRIISSGDTMDESLWIELIDTVLDSMRFYLHDFKVQSIGILLLGYMSVDSKMVDRAVHSGAIEAVVHALRYFPEDLDFQTNGLIVLVKVVLKERHVKRVARTRVLKLTLGALRRHISHSAVEACALSLLGTITDHFPVDIRNRMFVSYTPIVVAAMQAHPTNENVQYSGSLLLRKLAPIAEKPLMYSAVNLARPSDSICSTR